MTDPTLEQIRERIKWLAPAPRNIKQDVVSSVGGDLALITFGVTYQYEYEPRESASVWLARDMKKAEAEFLAYGPEDVTFLLDKLTKLQALVEAQDRLLKAKDRIGNGYASHEHYVEVAEAKKAMEAKRKEAGV